MACILQTLINKERGEHVLLGWQNTRLVKFVR